MVTTRRSGSLPWNNNKRTSSPPSDDNDKNNSSSKRLKDETNAAGNNSKSSSENPTDTSSDNPTDTNPSSVTLQTPVVGDGTGSEKKKSVLPPWKQYQGYEMTTPWCRLTEIPQNPTISVYTTNFLIGSSKQANLIIREQSISAFAVSIRLTKHDDKSVAVLESRGSKGCVQVNGKAIKKNTTCNLVSGDEINFGILWNHPYIFQQLPYEKIIKTPPLDILTNVGSKKHVEKQSGNESAVDGASTFVSLSVRPDSSRLKYTLLNKPDGDVSLSPAVNEDLLNGEELKSILNIDTETTIFLSS